MREVLARCAPAEAHPHWPLDARGYPEADGAATGGARALVNARDAGGASALCFAMQCQGNGYTAVEHALILVKAGADPRAANKDGITPLHYAAARFRDDHAALLDRRGGSGMLQHTFFQQSQNSGKSGGNKDFENTQSVFSKRYQDFRRNYY